MHKVIENTFGTYKLFLIFVGAPTKGNEWCNEYSIIQAAERNGFTHIISIEQKIGEDTYTTAPKGIDPSLLRETISDMLEEVKRMKKEFEKEKLNIKP